MYKKKVIELKMVLLGVFKTIRRLVNAMWLVMIFNLSERDDFLDSNRQKGFYFKCKRLKLRPVDVNYNLF